MLEHWNDYYLTVDQVYDQYKDVYNLSKESIRRHARKGWLPGAKLLSYGPKRTIWLIPKDTIHRYAARIREVGGGRKAGVAWTGSSSISDRQQSLLI